MEIPSGRIKDITGNQYGTYIVLRFSHTDKSSNSVWECKCKCGNINYVSRSWLKTNPQSCFKCCGRIISKSKTEDLVGQKCNRLTALRRIKQKKDGNFIWEWLCDCGNIVEIPAGYVKSGNTKSCGCLKIEETIKHNILFKRKPDNHSNKNTKYCHYRNHAKNKGIDFELTFNQFVELSESNCYYCDDEPASKFKANRNSGIWISNGIDRVDSTKGYTKNNTVSCCKQCNTMKMDYSIKEFYDKVCKIYRKHIV